MSTSNARVPPTVTLSSISASRPRQASQDNATLKREILLLRQENRQMTERMIAVENFMKGNASGNVTKEKVTFGRNPEQSVSLSFHFRKYLLTLSFYETAMYRD